VNQVKVSSTMLTIANESSDFADRAGLHQTDASEYFEAQSRATRGKAAARVKE